MAAGKCKVYNTAKEKLGQAIIDLDGHTFKCALFTSSSNCNTLTHDELADLTNEVANGNGYTTGGVTLAGVTWVNTAGVIKFSCSTFSWAVTGGGIIAKYGVIYDDTVAGDPLLLVFQLSTSGNISAISGDFITVQPNASGLFTLSGATTD